MRIKTTSRTTVIVLRICVVTLLITHACRSLIRNSVWHDRQSLFTYVDALCFAHTLLTSPPNVYHSSHTELPSWIAADSLCLKVCIEKNNCLLAGTDACV